MTHEFKRILVALVPSDTGKGGATAATRFGVDMARRFGACLTFQSFMAHAVMPYSPVGGFAGGLVAAENKRRRELAETAAASAKSVADEAGLSSEVDTPDLPFDALVDRFNRQTRLHDVTVLDAAGEFLAENNYVIEEALFNSGRPVVVVPDVGGTAEPQRIAIAWDGSARSARAVSDALPLLQAAQTASIIMVGGEKDLSRGASGVDLRAYLELHGVRASIEQVSAKSGDVAEALRQHVVNEGLDMIIMGAFVHSRFRQAVLGGVTRSLLESSPVPLLMAH